MTAPWTADEAGITAALAALGSTRDDVAAHLLALGCVGERSACGRCPIALYLHTVLGLGVDDRVAVYESAVALHPAGAVPSTWIDTPTPVELFIRRFDHGEYGELVA